MRWNCRVTHKLLNQSCIEQVEFFYLKLQICYDELRCWCKPGYVLNQANACVLPDDCCPGILFYQTTLSGRRQITVTLLPTWFYLETYIFQSFQTKKNILNENCCIFRSSISHLRASDGSDFIKK